MDEFCETPSSASVSSQAPQGIGNDSSQRTDFLASLRKPGRRAQRKRKAPEDGEGEGEGGGSESERYRVLAREAVWCAFLFGACEKKLFGAAIRRCLGGKFFGNGFNRECLLLTNLVFAGVREGG